MKKKTTLITKSPEEPESLKDFTYRHYGATTTHEQRRQATFEWCERYKITKIIFQSYA